MLVSLMAPPASTFCTSLELEEKEQKYSVVFIDLTKRWQTVDTATAIAPVLAAKKLNLRPVLKFSYYLKLQVLQLVKSC